MCIRDSLKCHGENGLREISCCPTSCVASASVSPSWQSIPVPLRPQPEPRALRPSSLTSSPHVCSHHAAAIQRRARPTVRAAAWGLTLMLQQPCSCCRIRLSTAAAAASYGRPAERRGSSQQARRPAPSGRLTQAWELRTRPRLSCCPRQLRAPRTITRQLKRAAHCTAHIST